MRKGRRIRDHEIGHLWRDNSNKQEREIEGGRVRFAVVFISYFVARRSWYLCCIKCYSLEVRGVSI